MRTAASSTRRRSRAASPQDPYFRQCPPTGRRALATGRETATASFRRLMQLHQKQEGKTRRTARADGGSAVRRGVVDDEKLERSARDPLVEDAPDAALEVGLPVVGADDGRDVAGAHDSISPGVTWRRPWGKPPVLPKSAAVTARRKRSISRGEGFRVKIPPLQALRTQGPR